LKGMSHITGGGFIENIPRVLPDGLGCQLDVSSYPLPPVFQWLMKTGNVAPLEMARTFNNGIGMVIIVGKEHVEENIKLLSEGGETVLRIGEVTSQKGVDIRGLESWKPSS
jgi:phosphoribosylamine--glycine ligase/phosphoribosylformylglycinamidine cyclo-ligase